MGEERFKYALNKDAHRYNDVLERIGNYCLRKAPKSFQHFIKNRVWQIEQLSSYSLGYGLLAKLCL